MVALFIAALDPLKAFADDDGEYCCQHHYKFLFNSASFGAFAKSQLLPQSL